MLKMKTGTPPPLTRILANNISPGNSVERFLKQKMLLKKSSTSCNDKLYFSSFSTSKSESNNDYKKRKKSPNKKNLSLKFIDQIDNAQPLVEIINIESFKLYNIEISEEGFNQKCSCELF